MDCIVPSFPPVLKFCGKKVAILKEMKYLPASTFEALTVFLLSCLRTILSL